MNLPSRFSNPALKIGFLRIQEKRLVEASHLIPDRTPHQETSAAQPLDFAAVKGSPEFKHPFDESSPKILQPCPQRSGKGKARLLKASVRVK
jgi:hypothetical protein